MPRSHTRTDHATPDDDLQQVLCGLEQELRELSQRWPAAQDFERFEDRVHHLFIAAERAVLRRELAQLDVDRPALTLAKQRYRRHRVLRATDRRSPLRSSATTGCCALPRPTPAPSVRLP